MGVRGKTRRPRRIQKLDLQRTLFVLPNLITLASIFCGFNAILVVSLDNPRVEDFYRAAILLMFSTLFDLMDGRVARLTRTQSAFGLQIDSLADVVSFGVAPAVLMYKWMLYRFDLLGSFVAFMFVACGAIRLARFNVLSSTTSGTPLKPGKYIVGLPTPPAAGVLISLLLANQAVGGALSDERYSLALLVCTIVLSLLMVSSVKFRSFKDMKFSAGTAIFVMFAIGSSAVVWHFSRPQFVLLWLLCFYLAIGLFEGIRSLAGRLLGHTGDSGADSSVPPEVQQPSEP